MFGKEKCRMLRQIRRKIAEENDIPLVTRECTHKGACRGTCPACESELRYLEQELARRQAMGKKAAVAALAVGMAFSSAGCTLVNAVRDAAIEICDDRLGRDLLGAIYPDERDYLTGEVAYYDGTEIGEPISSAGDQPASDGN